VVWCVQRRIKKGSTDVKRKGERTTGGVGGTSPHNAVEGGGTFIPTFGRPDTELLADGEGKKRFKRKQSKGRKKGRDFDDPGLPIQ